MKKLKIPNAVKKNAKLGLELRNKHGLVSTSRIGYSIAQKILSGHISERDITRMARFFGRWEKRSKKADPKSLVYVNWLLWGGDEGQIWSSKQISSLGNVHEGPIVNLNKKFNSIEVRYTSKPPLSIRKTLAKMDFKWSISNGHWYKTDIAGSLKNWLKDGTYLTETSYQIILATSRTLQEDWLTEILDKIQVNKSKIKVVLSDKSKQKLERIGIDSDLDLQLVNLSGLEIYSIEKDPYKDSDIGLGAITNNQVYDIITEKIIKALDSGNLAWRQSWKSLENYGLPASNFVSKKAYRGINSFMLNFIIPFERKKSWENPYFLTFKQIQELGGKLKKGSEGYMVTYFQMIYKLDNKKISEKEYVEYYAKCKENPKLEYCNELESIPILRYYKVFNGDDIEDIDFNITKIDKKSIFDKINSAESLIKNYPEPGPELIRRVPDQAFYFPATDQINLPPTDFFDKEQDYYSVYFHELIHSTGSNKRLKRDLSGKFRSISYRKEELVAELGACFLCGESGILYHTFENSAAYLQSYRNSLIKNMEKDNKFFFKAASNAQAAADFILQRNDQGIPKFLIKDKKTSKSSSKSKSTKIKKADVQLAAPDQKLNDSNVQEDLDVMTGSDILQKEFDVLDFNGPWGEFMQSPGANFKIVIFGRPKNGKTSFAFQLADYLSGFSPILYVLADQGITEATKKLIREMKVGGNDQIYYQAFRDLKTLRKYLDSGQFRFVFIDLINNFQISATQMEEIFHQYPDIGFALVMESTKAGDFRGEQKWTHIVDAIVKVENWVAENTGRYGSGFYEWPKPSLV